MVAVPPVRSTNLDALVEMIVLGPDDEPGAVLVDCLERLVIGLVRQFLPRRVPGGEP